MILVHVICMQLVGTARAGDVVGEIGVLCYRPQLFTARTRSLSQLLRMERTAFLRIVQASVGDGVVIINNLIQVSLLTFTSHRKIEKKKTEKKKTLNAHFQNACCSISSSEFILLFFSDELVNSNGDIVLPYSQYLKEKKESGAVAGVAEEIEYMMARGQLELPVTLCYAATKGDDFLLHQLLKRGVDPNESDNYWHTALVNLRIQD